ncbi:unnamed protein product [Phaedon cochleariae]|uniref:Endonuclease-reverse transcriptase n=1 Tax=Phaedon cochleariae TaxID=80249 RepID=A0A9P0DMC6_PHACE|nr:unnamed protein product [Phaedon cochleariae]
MTGKSNEDLFAMLEKVLQQNDDIKKDISKLNNNLEDIREDIKEIRQENKTLEEENKILNNKIESLENKLKKYNIIIYGLKEEREEVTQSVVVKLFREKLEEPFNETEIRDCYRIGKSEGEKPRPVLVEFVRYFSKKNILAKSKTLKKEEGVFITLDYTAAEYKRRKLLHKHLKSARETDHLAYIKNNVLCVDAEKYTYEDIVKNRIPNFNNLGASGETEIKARKGEKRTNENSPDRETITSKPKVFISQTVRTTRQSRLN